MMWYEMPKIYQNAKLYQNEGTGTLGGWNNVWRKVKYTYM